MEKNMEIEMESGIVWEYIGFRIGHSPLQKMFPSAAFGDTIMCQTTRTCSYNM